jgi:hypothetical protein
MQPHDLLASLSIADRHGHLPIRDDVDGEAGVAGAKDRLTGLDPHCLHGVFLRDRSRTATLIREG